MSVFKIVYSLSSYMNVIIMFMDGMFIEVFCRLTVNLNVGPIPCTYSCITTYMYLQIITLTKEDRLCAL